MASLVELAAHRGRRRERRVWNPNPTLLELLGGVGRSEVSAVHAQARSYDGAKAHAAVYGCVDLLCRLISTMPVDQYRTTSAGRVEVEPSMLVARPSPEPWMPAEGWRRQVLESWLLRGYSAGLVLAERNGWPEQVQIVHPDQVTWQRDKASGLRWRLDGREVGSWWDGSGPLWVAPSLHATPGSPVGASALRHAAGTIALGLGAHRFGSDWFDNSAHPSGVVGIDVPEITELQAKEIKARWKTSVAAREPVVLAKVASYEPIQIAANESQFLETIAANQAEVCMFFGVPPESIGASSGDSMTYANVEGRNLGLLTNTVGAWLKWLEVSLSALLPTGEYVKVVPDALLRTNTNSRFGAYDKAIRAGFMTVNEVRSLEDLPPVTTGDEALWPPGRAFPLDNDATPKESTEPVEVP